MERALGGQLMYTMSCVKIKEKSSWDPYSGYGSPRLNPLAEQIKEAVAVSNESAQMVVKLLLMHISRASIVNDVSLSKVPMPTDIGDIGGRGKSDTSRRSSGGGLIIAGL